MLAKEITESIIDSGIDDHLKELGYRKLGQGVDQQAWEEPNTGYVLKIFGTGYKREKLSPDQKMFYYWAKFCEENSNNPYLPKFYGIEQFKYNGRTYIQFRQERLYKNPKFTTELTQSLAEAIADNESFDKWMIHINALAKIKNVEHFKKTAKMFSDREQLKQIEDFYNTLRELKKIGGKRRWYLDVHDENIMMRADTTPVISDPWVL